MDFTGGLAYYTDKELSDAGYIVTGVKTMDGAKKTVTLYVNTAENIERVHVRKSLQKT